MYPPKVTHPSTNRVRRRVASFMRRTTLTTTPRRWVKGYKCDPLPSLRCDVFCVLSCEEVDSLRVSIASTDGDHSGIGVYCADKRPPTLMSGASGSLHVTLTSLSSAPPPAAASASLSGFSANFSFVTGTCSPVSSILQQIKRQNLHKHTQF